jgi:hypothetical protein
MTASKLSEVGRHVKYTLQEWPIYITPDCPEWAGHALSMFALYAWSSLFDMSPTLASDM